MRSWVLRASVASCLCLAAAHADAATKAPAPSVDPRIERALLTGLTGMLRPPAPLRTVDTAPVLIELRAPANDTALQELRAAGARLSAPQNAPLAYRQFVPARVDAGALHRLAALPSVKRIALSPAPAPMPLDTSTSLLQLEAARGARPALDLLTGKGMLMADLDSNADVFHPQFFFADAGYFDWIDTDDNGVFDASTDAIDLDRDGVAGANEKAVLLRAETLYIGYAKKASARDPGFDPAIDWLYLDENGNGKRDYGKASGFDDAVPGFGEPLFVPDDLNRNGKLDPGERVARLGTSKFRKVYVHIEYYADVDHVFERGKDLTEHKNEYTGGMSGYSDALHGSAVISILAGDVPLAGRRWVGMAPDAEVVLGYEVSDGLGTSITWALKESPDVVLHETAGWTGVPMDGSDAYSAMVDTSVAEDQVTHTCPMGNLGGSQKHAHVAIPKGSTVNSTFEVPAINAYYVGLSLNVRGATGVRAILHEPGGATHDLSTTDTALLGTGAYLWVSRETSSRGTRFTDSVIYTDPSTLQTKPVPTGTWTVELLGDPDADAVLDGYLMDDISGWSKGVAWDGAISTDDSTTGVPAVSDHCIAVGAMTGHSGSAAEPWFGDPSEPGAVKDFSGRGPRIDGVQKPDVIAPENPWAAAPAGKALQGTVAHGAVWPFGGTSGATPHVTGITALMAQAGIRGDAAREAIRQGAVSDATTGEMPNKDFGYGRMSAARALGVVKPDGERPVLSLQASAQSAQEGTEVVLTPTASDTDSTALEVKWDDGYDGTWDTTYGPVQARTVKLDKAGAAAFKARVRDEGGRIAEAMVRVQVMDKPEVDAGADAGDVTPLQAASDEGGDDGCGCRAAGSERGGAAALAAALLALCAGRRRRRARQTRRRF